MTNKPQSKERLSDAELQALRELEAKATQGEWQPWADEGDRYSMCVESESGHQCVASFSYKNDKAVEDCRLSAATRNAIVPLLDEIAELRRDQKRLDWYLANRTKITQWINPMNGHGWRLLVDGSYEGEGSTQRDALDAAMQESENAALEEGK